MITKRLGIAGSSQSKTEGKRMETTPQYATDEQKKTVKHMSEAEWICIERQREIEAHEMEEEVGVCQ